MKINLKTDFWDKTTDWQNTFNKNLWITTALFIYIITSETIRENYTGAIIMTIVLLISIGPQRLTYSKWNKKRLHKKYGIEE